MGDIKINHDIPMTYAKFGTMTNLVQNSKIPLKTRVKFLNNFVYSRLTSSCQNRNLTVGQLENLDIRYRNHLRRMIRGGFKPIGPNNGDFRYNLNNEKVHLICCASYVSNFIRKQQEDYAGHVVRIPIERCEKQLIFHNHKYHRIRRVTPSLLKQVLKFNNSTVDNFFNGSKKY